MLENLFVIDDFYENPDSIRNVALSTKYLKFNDDANFPGYESINSFFAEEHSKRFSTLVEKEIMINPEKYVFGKFRYAPEGAKSYSDMHIDSPDWAAMIYLTPESLCQGGLGIYRHKKSNIFKVPQTENDFKEIGFSNFSEMDSKLVYPDSKNPDAWELVELIPMKYNRLILFKGSMYFHQITEKFGNTVEDSRLSHSFFFNEKK